MGKKINLGHVTLLKNHVLGNYLSFNKAQALTDAQKIIAKSNLSIEEIKLATSITWSALKSLRDNSQLVAGQLYRIIDYVTTTAQTNTTSANHPFDVIVLATDVNHINEQAYAIQHQGDTYFANSKLDAWKIWYCLDNDSNRFEWAIAPKPFRIKIMDTEFYRSPEEDDTNYTYGLCWKSDYYCAYTNTENPTINDMVSMVFPSDKAFYKIEEVIPATTEEGKGVIYRMIDEFNNDCPYDFKNIQFYRKWNPTKKLWCDIGTINDGVAAFTFSSEGQSDTTIFTDYSLDIALYVYNNSIKYFVYNKRQRLNNNCFFGNYCYSNSFENNCNSNSFGNNCDSNSFGNNCNSNLFGNNCSSNSFGNYCSSNSFGIDCYSNSFGNNCDYNLFGNYCSSNSFGNNCMYNYFASDSNTTPGNYFYYNIIENGVLFCILYNTATASQSQQVKNYHIKSSIVGTSSAKVLIEATRNIAYDTTVAKNSAGVVKQYCEADLIQ